MEFATHAIGADAREAMLHDDYDAFVLARVDEICTVVESVTGKAITRDHRAQE